MAHVLANLADNTALTEALDAAKEEIIEAIGDIEAGPEGPAGPAGPPLEPPISELEPAVDGPVTTTDFVGGNVYRLTNPDVWFEIVKDEVTYLVPGFLPAEPE